jgi:hypothetical protein
MGVPLDPNHTFAALEDEARELIGQVTNQGPVQRVAAVAPVPWAAGHALSDHTVPAVRRLGYVLLLSAVVQAGVDEGRVAELRTALLSSLPDLGLT